MERRRPATRFGRCDHQLGDRGCCQRGSAAHRAAHVVHARPPLHPDRRSSQADSTVYPGLVEHSVVGPSAVGEVAGSRTGSRRNPAAMVHRDWMERAAPDQARPPGSRSTGPGRCVGGWHLPVDQSVAIVVHDRWLRSGLVGRRAGYGFLAPRVRSRRPMTARVPVRAHDSLRRSEHPLVPMCVHKWHLHVGRKRKPQWRLPTEWTRRGPGLRFGAAEISIPLRSCW